MKLHRIALQEFRKFRQPVVLHGLTAGLNVIAGPNEAGKSTLAAAIRAAFLERYKTTKVADLVPWGMSGARPSVEIEFEHAGRRYLLRKSFLNRARCELLIDNGAERYEGEAAENALATLLGFEFSAKGNSRPEHGGIPGLLWIAQGEGQNLLAPAAHAQTHVREALTRLTGELTSADGDSLFERVESERSTLRDGRSGRPKGAYKEAEDALSQVEQSIATLTAAKQALDADVDRLALLRRDYDRAHLEQPWLALEQRAQDARTRLAKISREQDALTGLKRELTQAEDTLALLHEQVERDQRDEAALSASRAAAGTAQASLAPASEYLSRALQQQQQADERLRCANAQLASVQQAAQRQDCASQIRDGEQELKRGLAAIERAEALLNEVQTLETRAAQLEIDAHTLSSLRGIEQRLVELRIQQNVGATRVYHQLDAGQTLRFDGRELAGAGELLVAQATTLQIPGMGTLRIEPGGQDLPGVLAAVERSEVERVACLVRLGVATLSEAESRAAAYGHVQRDLEMARQTLRIQAPDGVDTLRAGQSRLQTRLAQLQTQLASFPADAVTGDVVQAGQALQSATVEAEHAAKAVTTARTALDTQQAKAQLLREQWTDRQTEFDSHERVAQRELRSTRLVEARATLTTLTQRCQAAQAALQASQPDLIEQDARRFEQSAKLQRDEQQRRHAELLQLQGKLEQAQAHGVGEQLAQAQAQAQRLTRRRDEFISRAQALDLLWQLLGERRAHATQRLLDPLAQRLQHYAGLLFPGARWHLDEALMPTAVVRSTGSDTTQALETLSFGTREQLGVLARFAYADLLQQAGRPTLLILDDALVHADRERRDLIKRALYDAASRHQIFLLTCHGEVWQDLGVPVRSVPEMDR